MLRARAEARALAVAGLGACVVASPVDHHERAVVIAEGRDGRVVVKADVDLRRLTAEAAALSAAAAGGVRVPEVVAAEPGLLVLGWLEGRPLHPDDDVGTWHSVGATFRQLHRTQTTGFAVVPAGWVDAFEGWGRADLEADPVSRAAWPQVEAALARAIDARPGTTDLTQGDAQLDHTFVGDAGPGLLDFGEAGLADGLIDLVVLTVGVAHRLPLVLDGYEADRSLRERLALVGPAVALIRLAAGGRWMREHGMDDAWHVTALAAAVAALPT